MASSFSAVYPALYPLIGVYHLLSHRSLHPLLRTSLAPALLLSIAVLFFLFFWTYVPQALLLLPFHGARSAFVNAAFLVLGEGAAISALLFEAFVVDGALVDAFDVVLVEKGFEDLVQQARVVRAAEGPGDAPVSSPPAQQAGGSNDDNNNDNTTTTTADAAPAAPAPEQSTPLTPLSRLGPASSTSSSTTTKIPNTYSPFSLVQITEFILLLPLNLVPYVGVPAFLFLTGSRAGPLHHYRYFRLRGLWKRKQRDAQVAARRSGYTFFGTVALVLQLVPGLSMLFLVTTAVGSGVWAAELEAERRERRERVGRVEGGGERGEGGDGGRDVGGEVDGEGERYRDDPV